MKQKRMEMSGFIRGLNADNMAYKSGIMYTKLLIY